MYTEIRTAITTAGKTVNENFFYKLASENQTGNYFVFSFYSDSETRDTASRMITLGLQVGSYASTEAQAESQLDSMETALLGADLNTTSYAFLGITKTGRVPFPPDLETAEIGLISQFTLWFEIK